MKLLALVSGLILSWGLAAQSLGPFAPAAGLAGSTAIHKDSSIIKAWGDSIYVERGFLDIAHKSLGRVSYGDSLLPLGPADGQVISLGDSGRATYVLSTPLVDQEGAEFALFENSFSDVFLEFAFVELSADGQNFYRFPAICLLDSTPQTGAFGSSEPSRVKNLAGKYRGDYGQPFDLADIPPIDTVRYIRVVDVIGSINAPWVNRDSQGRPINDPYPSAFASGGFDLDALAILHQPQLSKPDRPLTGPVFPNPASREVRVRDAQSLSLFNLNGKLLKRRYSEQLRLDGVEPGLYILIIEDYMGQERSAKLRVRP